MINIVRMNAISKIAKLFKKSTIATTHSVISARLIKMYTNNDYEMVSAGILQNVPFLTGLNDKKTAEYLYKMGFSENTIKPLAYRRETLRLIYYNKIFEHFTWDKLDEVKKKELNNILDIDCINDCLLIHNIGERACYIDAELRNIIKFDDNERLSIYEFEKQLYDSMTI